MLGMSVPSFLDHSLGEKPAVTLWEYSDSPYGNVPHGEEQVARNSACHWPGEWAGCRIVLREPSDDCSPSQLSIRTTTFNERPWARTTQLHNSPIPDSQRKCVKITNACCFKLLGFSTPSSFPHSPSGHLVCTSFLLSFCGWSWYFILNWNKILMSQEPHQVEFVFSWTTSLSMDGCISQ